MHAYLDTVSSPAGPVAFAVDEDGALLRAQFREGRHDRTIEQQLEADGYLIVASSGKTERVKKELLEYQAGTRVTFDVPVRFVGSEWQRTVWEALTRIPFGETRSYGEVAAMIGRPGAARAVGRANATNKIPLVVPCHRVIGASGTLTGFGGGLHLKERLLAHEAEVVEDRQRSLAS